MNPMFAQRSNDQALLYRLAEVSKPSSYDKIHLAALMMRYREAGEFHDHVNLVVKSWNLTPRQLFVQTREIWANGFHPDSMSESGSSWDASSGE
jgi:hypothetical protein